MELILTQVEINEDFLPYTTQYDVYFDGKRNFLAKLIDERYDNVPKELEYRMDKSFESFTNQEIKRILDYRGLTLEESGFEIGDVFMEATHIKLLTKI